MIYTSPKTVTHPSKTGLDIIIVVVVVVVVVVSASLSIRIAEQSTYVTDHVIHPCLSTHQYCGKTADWIWMPFGVLSGIGRGVGVLDGGRDRRSGRGSLG